MNPTGLKRLKKRVKFKRIGIDSSQKHTRKRPSFNDNLDSVLSMIFNSVMGFFSKTTGVILFLKKWTGRFELMVYGNSSNEIRIECEDKDLIGSSYFCITLNFLSIMPMTSSVEVDQITNAAFKSFTGRSQATRGRPFTGLSQIKPIVELRRSNLLDLLPQIVIFSP